MVYKCMVNTQNNIFLLFKKIVFKSDCFWSEGNNTQLRILVLLEQFHLTIVFKSSLFQKSGWGAKEMFQLNEEKYGVKSSFNSEMHAYT